MAARENKWVWFYPLDSDEEALALDEYLELECLSCGHEFSVENTLIKLNMVQVNGEWVPKCPVCGMVGEY